MSAIEPNQPDETPNQPPPLAWYYARQKTKVGPLTWERLCQLANEGQLQPSDMVLQDGNPRWIPAAQVPGLFPTASAGAVTASPIPETETILYPVALVAAPQATHPAPAAVPILLTLASVEAQRPRIILWTSVVNFLVAGVEMVLGVVGLVHFLKLKAEIKALPWKHPLSKRMDALEDMVPGWLNVEIGKASLVVVLGMVLMAASVGLLRMSSLSRRFCLGYALLAILLHVSYLLFEFAALGPALRGISMQDPHEIATMFGVLGAAGAFILHAIVLLFILTAPRVSRGFRMARSGNSGL